MSNPPPKSSDTIQAQVEQLTAEAKKLNSVRKEAQALETYRRAAELMPGAPWLQHRTAELARKLKQPEVAVHHYQRASAAFIGAGFPKRALAPLRVAWGLSVAALPANSTSFVILTLALAELQRQLGSAADGAQAIANANEALDAAGCVEKVAALSELDPQPIQKSSRSSDPGIPPPESGVKTAFQPAELGFLARVRTALKP